MMPYVRMGVALHRLCSPHWSRRVRCLSSPPSSSTSARWLSSAVNVEDFSLVEEVVQRDLANLSKWNELAEAMDSARAERHHSRMLEEVRKGLQLLEEIGAAHSPVQCETLLCMEGAQAHLQLQQFSEALRLLERAEASLEQSKPELRDRAMWSECQLLRGHILTLQGDGVAAEKVLEKVLNWINVEAKSAPPIQAVAGLNLKRSVMSAMGTAIVTQAKSLEKAGDELEQRAKPLYGKALDMLIDALDQHIDEKDSVSVKRSLENIFYCFEGVGDISQALTTCQKYVSWCSRQDDQEGIEFGKKLQEDFCQRHGVDPSQLTEK